MSRRVFFGKGVNGEPRAGISKPGFDARTAADADMLVTLQSGPVQVITRGVIFIFAGQTVSIPFGFTTTNIPLIICHSVELQGSEKVLRFPHRYETQASPTLHASTSRTGLAIYCESDRTVVYVAFTRQFV